MQMLMQTSVPAPVQAPPSPLDCMLPPAFRSPILFSNGAAYVRGKFVPIAEATIPVTDWGLTRSDAVYDVVHVFRGGVLPIGRPPEPLSGVDAGAPA